MLLVSSVASAADSVRVYGTGATFEDAKMLAFKEAVQYVCNTTVFTRRESRNDKLVLDTIKAANGCNVNRYKLVDSKVVNNTYILVYDVWVTLSNISNGLKSEVNNPGYFDGKLHQEQLKSYNDSINSQQDLVDEVFSYYPEHAFNIEQGNYSININNVGKPVFNISYVVSWNKNFLDSVIALLETAGRPGSVFKNGSANVVLMPKYDTILLSSMVPDVRKHYIYDESHVMDRIRFNMSHNKYAFMKIKFLDRQGNVLQSYCQDIRAPMYTFEYAGFAHFFYKQKDDNTFKVVLDVPLEKIYEYSINPVRSEEC